LFRKYSIPRGSKLLGVEQLMDRQRAGPAVACYSSWAPRRMYSRRVLCYHVGPLSRWRLRITYTLCALPSVTVH